MLDGRVPYKQLVCQLITNISIYSQHAIGAADEMGAMWCSSPLCYLYWELLPTGKYYYYVCYVYFFWNVLFFGGHYLLFNCLLGYFLHLDHVSRRYMHFSVWAKLPEMNCLYTVGYKHSQPSLNIN
jgi:hypothetical protein